VQVDGSGEGRCRLARDVCIIQVLKFQIRVAVPKFPCDNPDRRCRFLRRSLIECSPRRRRNEHRRHARITAARDRTALQQLRWRGTREPRPPRPRPRAAVRWSRGRTHEKVPSKAWSLGVERRRRAARPVVVAAPLCLLNLLAKSVVRELVAPDWFLSFHLLWLSSINKLMQLWELVEFSFLPMLRCFLDFF